jgi:methyltransferase
VLPMHYTLQPLFFIFLAIVAAERAWEMFFRKTSRETGAIEYKWSLSALLITYNLILCSTVIELFAVKREPSLSISLLGLLLFIFSFILRNWSIATLDRFHSTNIEIKPNHSLIIRGPYKYIRHPYYLSVMIEVLSIPLTVNSLYTIWLVLIIYVPCVLIRVYLEDRVFTRVFGEEFMRYKEDVRAFIPFRGFNRM